MRDTIEADEAGTCVTLARFLEVLSSPVRLRILRSLDGGEHRVSELVEIVGKRQQTISHHLTILKLGEVVAYQRRQKSNFYHLTPRGRTAVETVGALRLA